MWKDLAPELVRQRLVIEGTTAEPLTKDQVSRYLSGLSEALGMEARGDPILHSSGQGITGWLYWVSSGVTIHAYNDPPLFAVDAYTCKLFRPEDAVEYTREFLQPEEISWKEIGQQS